MQKLEKELKINVPKDEEIFRQPFSAAATAASANPKDAKVKLMKNIYSRENLERLRDLFLDGSKWRKRIYNKGVQNNDPNE